MAEEKINPQVEGTKIVKKYLSELGWAREFKRMVTRQLIPAIEKDVKFREGDKMEEAADENFGREIDRWREAVTVALNSLFNLKSGTDQSDAGAAAGELYQDTNDDNTIKIGV